MILIDGKTYFIYQMGHMRGETVGFDPRPIAEVEAEWLSKMKKASARMHEVQMRFMRAEKTPFFGEGEEADSIPPLRRGSSDEIFRLSGISSMSGFGAVALPANYVSEISFVLGKKLAETLDSFERVRGSGKTSTEPCSHGTIDASARVCFECGRVVPRSE